MLHIQLSYLPPCPLIPFCVFQQSHIIVSGCSPAFLAKWGDDGRLDREALVSQWPNLLTSLSLCLTCSWVYSCKIRSEDRHLAICVSLRVNFCHFIYHRMSLIIKNGNRLFLSRQLRLHRAGGSWAGRRHWKKAHFCHVRWCEAWKCL